MAPYWTWGSNSRPQDQEPHALPVEPARHPKMTSFSLGLCWFPVPSLLLTLSNPLTPRYLLSALASWLGFLDILLISSCTGVLIPQVQVPVPDTLGPPPPLISSSCCHPHPILKSRVIICT
ncbi:unnamed protein product [Gulo gulo]|uniref:Uncharacterized protein n=1 Tax=Gulo gulo TaxID=48420 RepID=A0A9X9Q1C4_GULGU|nr:unnamed protein product [Gulo gulo]